MNDNVTRTAGGGLDVRIAQELVEQARSEGLSLTGADGLLTAVTRRVIEAALEAEMTEHLGYAKGDRAAAAVDRDYDTVRWLRRRPKPPLSEAPAGPAAGLEASGPRSVVINTEGGAAPGMVVTGDGARVVQVPVEAWQPISEIATPAGIDNLPLLSGLFVGRVSELARLDAVLAHRPRSGARAIQLPQAGLVLGG